MAWGTLAESAWLACDADAEFFTDGTDAIVIALNPGESGTLTFNVDVAGTTDDLVIEVLQGHQIADSLALDAGGTTTVSKQPGRANRSSALRVASSSRSTTNLMSSLARG